MPCLHLVNSESALGQCLTVASEADHVLLLGTAAALASTQPVRPLLVLQDDIPEDLATAERVTPIDYAAFVDLAASHQPIITWR